MLGIAAIGAIARARGHGAGQQEPGGILIRDAGVYDLHTRILFGSLFRPIAADIAAVGPPSARILEVGCGPGHLSVRLARDHDLDVTGVDLDPRMIDRAQADADRDAGELRQPRFIVGDVAALPFDDASFDLVVSTFSMHHWSDPPSGLREISRVLRPDGKALIWHLRPGVPLVHSRMPDPATHVHAAPVRVVSVAPWRWPWRFTVSQRIELARD
jgi:ubiquinone/menaquinone biosynthesis C-methylase UbiE